MASEIGFDAGPGLTGITAYAILRNVSQQVWNTVAAAFQAWNDATIADYDLALVEQGTSGFYAGDMPVVTAGLYTLTIKQRAGASPAVTDTRIGGGEGDWNGTAWQTVANISSRTPTALVGGRMDSSVGAIAAGAITSAAFTAGAIDNAAFNVTETLTANPAAGGIAASSFAAGAIDAAAIAADAGTEIGTAVWASATRTLTAGTNIQLPATGLDLVLVDGQTLPRAVAIIGGVIAGKISGAGTGTETFLGFNGTVTAAVVVVDSNGNRTAVTY